MAKKPNDDNDADDKPGAKKTGNDDDADDKNTPPWMKKKGSKAEQDQLERGRLLVEQARTASLD